MDPVEREAVRLTAQLAATEQWPEIYSRTPEQHAQLLKQEAELQLILTKFFKNMQQKADTFVNWDQYHAQLARSHNHLSRDSLDYNVQVIVNDQQIDDNSGNFVKLTLTTVHNIMDTAQVASALLYKRPELASGSAALQALSTNQVAKLVGKKVQDDGSIIENPNKEYDVLDTVRNDIAQAVKTSLGLGETTPEATARIAQILQPVKRAELIAQTESVNAYSASVLNFGIQTKAVGKEWVTAGATDICATYAALSPVPIGDDFAPGVSGPTAHPRCRCALRLIYQQEWDAIQSGNRYEVNTGITPKA